MEDAARNESLARTGSKSPSAFRTIAEVSAELDLPQHVLRFWETKFAQIKPLKRGGGRRYYRPEDVTLLKYIRNLLYSDGYTIRGVQKLLRQKGARAAAMSNGGHDPSANTDSDESATCGLDNRQRDELRAVLHELEALRRLFLGHPS